MKKNKEKTDKIIRWIRQHWPEIVVVLAIVTAVSFWNWFKDSYPKVSNWLDSADLILGIITIAISFFAWVNTRNIQTRFREVSSKKTVFTNEQIAGLACSLGNGDNGESILNAIIGDKSICDLLGEESLITDSKIIKNTYFMINTDDSRRLITISCKALLQESSEVAEDMCKEFMKCIRIARQWLDSNQIKKVYLFYQGPSVMATYIEAEFANKIVLVPCHYFKTKYLPLPEYTKINL